MFLGLDEHSQPSQSGRVMEAEGAELPEENRIIIIMEGDALVMQHYHRIRWAWHAHIKCLFHKGGCISANTKAAGFIVSHEHLSQTLNPEQPCVVLCAIGYSWIPSAGV